ncbi:MAG: hypothetical protein CVT60_01590 [Actinobacteria bacterium HGW-Actinobacteria-10]|nr:MAG: hypothetical protein CVT60_01590 [Actinobacteria bacterium HGW-Actinobacteria-10]
MTIAASEFARLVVALSVIPFLVIMSRNMRFARGSRLPFVILLSAIYASYILTIVEGFFWFELLNALQHIAYGVAGLAAVPIAWRSRQDVLGEMGR